jgi:uncharacterized protein YdbL (DUF1318 family)
MIDSVGDADKTQEEVNSQIDADRAARAVAHQAIVEKYNAMASKQKSAYTKKSSLGKPVNGGWEKKGKFTPLT